MMVAGAVGIVAFVVIVMVMMMVVRLFLQLCQLDGDGAALLHRLHQLLAGELRPRGRDDHGVLVVFADHVDALVELFLSVMPSVRLRMMVLAVSIWLL